MSVILYRNAKGEEITHGSYSARETFHYCARKFQLNRVDGWQERDHRASTEFGHAVEYAFRFHEISGRAPETAVQGFERKWTEAQRAKDFKYWVYTDTEKNWDGLMRAGKELAMLYEIKVPGLPISLTPRARWSTKVVKELFPHSTLAGLENTAVLDILSWPVWDHALLPPVESVDVMMSSYPGTRPLIIDCKTSGKDLNLELVALDPQLIEYAWQMRIPDVAFLNPVKKGHTIERGDKVCLLRGVKGYPAASELLVLGQDKEKGLVFLGDPEAMVAYKRATKDFHPSSKAYAAAAEAFFNRDYVLSCAPTLVTKQRLLFGAARLTQQEMDEAGREVGRTTAEMVRAHEENFYPRTGGIRWPNDKCCNCAMRGICANKPDLRDRLLTREGEEWMVRQAED